jgi:flagellar biosynthetic protein FliQ
MENTIISIYQQALVAIVVISAPAAGVALATGLIVGVAQTATQVQEQTLAYVPKLLAVCGALVVAGPWMLSELMRLATAMLEQVAACGAW